MNGGDSLLREDVATETRVPGEGLSSADMEMVALMQRLGLSCPACKYDMRASLTPVCPECGKHVRKEDYRVRTGLPKSNALVAAIVGACQLLIVGPACMIALVANMTLPGAVEGLFVLLSVLACAAVLWVVAYRPLSVLALPSVTKWLVLGGLAAVGVLTTLGLMALPAWLFGEAMGWW